MKPLTLRLRGFKGIMSGSRNELYLDFSDVSGLVALTGPNGAGKTTVLDNLHPFRIMPYRSGSCSPRSFSFYNETVGSEALKELEFEINGCRYKSLILIDSDRKKQEAYLYERTVDMMDEAWKALNDGRTDSYDRAVENLIGSPQLFFTGVFRCQDASRLSDYTKGEMKAIFVELLSIEDMKEISLDAKSRKDAILKKKEWLEHEKNRLSSTVNEAEKSKTEVSEVETKVKELEKEAVLLKEKIKDRREKLHEIEAQAALHEKALSEKNNLERALRELNDKKKKAESILSKAKAVKEAAVEVEHLNCKIEVLKLDAVRIDEKIAGFEAEEKIFRDYERKLLEAKKKLSEMELTRKHHQENTRKELQRTKESVKLLGEVPCGPELHEKCAFLNKAVKERGTIPELVRRLKSYESFNEKDVLEAEIKKLNSLLLPYQEMVKGKVAVLKQRNDERVSSLKAEESLKKCRNLAALLPEVEFSEAVYPSLLSEGEEIEKKLRSLTAQGTSPVEVLKTVKAEIMSLEKTREKFEGDLRTFTSRLAVLRKIIVDGEDATKEVISLDERLKVMQQDISEWIVLEKAFGDNGIIALEIDDAGPSISAIANDLLLSCFGPRFSVRIDTQAAKAGGKGLKETFDIVVFDTERDESKSLKVLSGGEKVWIEEAVTRAICLYNAGKSGKRFQTLFTDEKDGALDFRRKKEFMNMKRKALEIGGFDIEFFISQSPEIQELADSTIDMEVA